MDVGQLVSPTSMSASRRWKAGKQLELCKWVAWYVCGDSLEQMRAHPSQGHGRVSLDDTSLAFRGKFLVLGASLSWVLQVSPKEVADSSGTLIWGMDKYGHRGGAAQPTLLTE